MAAEALSNRTQMAIKNKNEYCGCNEVCGVTKLLIPVADQAHWGLAGLEAVAADGCITKAFKIWWGDSAGRAKFNGLQSAFVDIVEAAFPGAMVGEPIAENHLTGTLGWAAQQDNWSCGLYMIGAIRQFAVDSD